MKLIVKGSTLSTNPLWLTAASAKDAGLLENVLRQNGFSLRANGGAKTRETLDAEVSAAKHLPGRRRLELKIMIDRTAQGLPV